MFDTKVVEKIKTQILCSIIFIPTEIRAGYDIMWKNTVQPYKPQQTKQNRSHMARAHCMLNNEGYRHTFRIKVKVKFAL